MEKVIEISGLKKSFEGNTVLEDITLDLGKEENLVILGKSGEGKSVTIKCIVGMMTADAGSIKVFGQEVSQMTEKEIAKLRTRIGFLFQGGALYDSMTVLENLAFPLVKVLHITNPGEINDRCHDALEAVGLPDDGEKMPSSLSGGMRKRMALARTLVVHPEIMLYDEPTTGLDTITSGEISELILKVQDKYHTSSMIITHDMDCAKITSDRVIILSGGKCVAVGTFDQLKSSKEPLASAFFKTIL